VIVGAGMSGLACATRLAELGWRVAVLEARTVLGGRASSWVDRRVGEEIDNGPHLFAGAYREVARLLARVGAGARLRSPGRLRVPLWSEDGRRAVLEWKARSGLAGLGLGFARFSPLSHGARVRLLSVVSAARLERGEPDRPLGQWLDLLGQGREARRWLWDPLARAVFNDEPDGLSARLFAGVVRRLFLEGPAAAALAHATVGLSQVYAEPSATYLAERRSRVFRGTAARWVASLDPGFEVPLEKGAVRARSVCLAVPADRACSLLGDSAASRVQGLAEAARAPHAPLVSVNLWLEGDAPAVEEPFVGFPDSEFAWCFDRTALVGGTGARRHVALVAPGARGLLERRAEELVAEARAVLDAHAPASAHRALVASRVVKEPMAAPSLTPAVAATRPEAATKIPGLALAGDWTETGLPATLEGAAWSGHRAAHALHRYLASSPA